MKKFEIKHRSFAAMSAAPGSDRRKELNRSAETSEYMPSYRYILVVRNEDGSLAWTTCYRTRTEAEKARSRHPDYRSEP